MKELMQQQVWTRTCTEEEYRGEKRGKQKVYKGKCPKANPGQFERCTDFKTASAAAKKSGTNIGFLASRENSIITIDIDVADKGSDYGFDVDGGSFADYVAKNPDTGKHIAKYKSKNIPATVLDFIKSHPTYARYSKSGRGLHVYYRIAPDDIELLNKQKLKYRAQTLAQGPFSGEVFWDTNFIVWGPKRHELSTKDKIQTITLDELTELIPVLAESPDNVVDIKSGKPVDASTANSNPKSLPYIKNKLFQIPTSFTHEISFAYQRFPNLSSPPSSDYLHWVFIGHALANEAKNRASLYADIRIEHDFYALFNEWSARDNDKYDEESCQEKWNSLMSSSAAKDDYISVTINSLFLLAKHCGIDWPVKKLRVNKNSPTGFVETNLPVNEELENFDAVLKFYGLKAKVDTFTSEVYVSGPNDILKQSFMFEGAKVVDDRTAALSAEQFIFCVTRLCQRRAGYQGFKVRTAEMLSKYWLSMFSKKVNPVHDWIASTKWDGKSRMEEYLDTYEFNAEHGDHIIMYREYIRKMLLTIIAKNFLTTPVSCEGILILSGPQNCHKTTALEEILPTSLAKYVSNSNITMLKSQQSKDTQGEVTSRALIILDEVERSLDSNQAASDLKNFISRSVDTFRRWYDRETGNYNRMAVYVAATNLPELSLSRYGNRRIWFVPVTRIRTKHDGVLSKPGFRAQLFAELLHIFNEHKEDPIKPWQLTEEEVAITERLNAAVASLNDIDYALIESYDWDTPFDQNEFKKQMCSERGNINQKILNVCHREVGQYTIASAPGMARHLKNELGGSQPPKAAAVKHALTDRVLKWLVDVPDVAGEKINRSRGTVKLPNNGIYYVLPVKK